MCNTAQKVNQSLGRLLSHVQRYRLKSGRSFLNFQISGQIPYCIELIN